MKKLWYLLPLMALLYGCQPDTPAQQAESTAPALGQVAPSAVASASGSDGLVLAQKSGCFACHAIDRKMVGPAWDAIAAKYRGQKDAEAKLIAKVSKGGSGVWGNVPMPPNVPRISESDVQALVRFILSLK